MNYFLLSFFISSFSVSHQTQSSKSGEISIDWEIKDSLSCYRNLTLDLFQNLKKVIPPYCIQEGENEFKLKIQPRSNNRFLITKNGPTKDLFMKAKKQAEEIGSKTIDKIHRCVAYDCSSKKQKEIDESIKIFRKGQITCGDSEYLESSIKFLESSCTEEKMESISRDAKSYFFKNSFFYGAGANDRWAKK